MRTPLQYLKDEGIFGWNYKHLLTHPWILVPEMYRRTKWFIQRGHRGYADIDSWSIDGYLNSWMPEAIRKLKVEFGYPVSIYLEMFPNEDWTDMNPIHSDLAHARWHTLLEEMAQGFESAKKITQFDFEGATELDALTKKMQRGLWLFSRYYLNLWS